MGISFPEVRRSGRVTDVIIISEVDPWKKEAGMVQGVMARQDKRQGVGLRR
jgi:hypothetical protein